ncbi:hypothetical protein QLF87_23900, partial [Salmonella enterica subsp. enterica serovar Oslo]|nr:hypothetical protein [Salmonella enterica subsp. enterica serovar Oslo]
MKIPIHLVEYLGCDHANLQSENVVFAVNRKSLFLSWGVSKIGRLLEVHKLKELYPIRSVSYTHLTLPTKL